MSRTQNTPSVVTEPSLLTVAEACSALQISRNKFYDLLHRQQIRSIKIGSRRLISANALNDFIESHEALGVGR